MKVGLLEKALDFKLYLRFNSCDNWILRGYSFTSLRCNDDLCHLHFQIEKSGSSRTARLTLSPFYIVLEALVHPDSSFSSITRVSSNLSTHFRVIGILVTLFKWQSPRILHITFIKLSYVQQAVRSQDILHSHRIPSPSLSTPLTRTCSFLAQMSRRETR